MEAAVSSIFGQQQQSNMARIQEDRERRAEEVARGKSVELAAIFSQNMRPGLT
jgi:hypothetical protein